VDLSIDLANPFDNPAVSRRYEGKVAVVTGAAAGIGRATALRLAAEGASVWCADVAADGVAETEKMLLDHGAAARSSVVDVTDVAQVQALVADVVGAFGGLDVVANIAGIGGSAHALDETPERFAAMFNVNAAGPFNLIQAALPQLLERHGNVVNLASTAGVIGQAYCAAYCASKHALVGLTRSLAIEYGRKNVRFNAVCPGGVNTNIINAFAPPEEASMSLISRSYLTIEMQEPESVAAMVAYVGSDEAYYVNGALLSIDGGTTTG
jgi:meso-butanediol dehydrogenase/(S,S)-butanediol dehydrogenase/diacetyl reductase